jgi:hypothetical protein
MRFYSVPAKLHKSVHAVLVGFFKDYTFVHSMQGKGKSKVYPRTGHEDPEGEYRYSPTLSLTSALDGSG